VNGRTQVCSATVHRCPCSAEIRFNMKEAEAAGSHALDRQTPPRHLHAATWRSTVAVQAVDNLSSRLHRTGGARLNGSGVIKQPLPSGSGEMHALVVLNWRFFSGSHRFHVSCDELRELNTTATSLAWSKAFRSLLKHTPNLYSAVPLSG